MDAGGVDEGGEQSPACSEVEAEMKVRVSKHAIQRFRERSPNERNESHIVRLLTAIVLLSADAWKQSQWKIVNRKMVLVGVTNGDSATVRSCWFL